MTSTDNFGKVLNEFIKDLKEAKNDPNNKPDEGISIFANKLFFIQRITGSAPTHAHFNIILDTPAGLLGFYEETWATCLTWINKKCRDGAGGMDAYCKDNLFKIALMIGLSNDLHKPRDIQRYIYINCGGAQGQRLRQLGGSPKLDNLDYCSWVSEFDDLDR